MEQLDLFVVNFFCFFSKIINENDDYLSYICGNNIRYNYDLNKVDKRR